jgi:hypothetical protein
MNPFRVHVLQPRRWWIFKRLVVVYSFNSNPAHADHGKHWRRNCGLCWKVYRTKQAQWCHRNDSEWKELGLSDEDLRATSHVWGVFALPLRKPKQDAATISNKVTAVLAMDALTEEGAVALKDQFDRFMEHRNEKLLDRAAWTSLFFG